MPGIERVQSGTESKTCPSDSDKEKILHFLHLAPNDLTDKGLKVLVAP